LQEQAKFQQTFAPDQIMQEFISMKQMYVNSQEEDLKMLSEKSSIDSEKRSNHDGEHQEEEGATILLNKDIEEEDLQDRITHNDPGKKSGSKIKS